MSDCTYFRLPAISIVEISGRDAGKIINNLTTNQILSLPIGGGCETFVTEVRGKTLGHGYLYACDDRFLFLGPPGQSEKLVAHIDRYTIIEDATPRARDAELIAIAFDPGAAERLGIATAEFHSSRCSLGNLVITTYPVAWLGAGSAVALMEMGPLDQAVAAFAEHALSPGEESEFHRRRVAAKYPWYGMDLDETNLPQEIDRDATAISFTKGCYLGQETVARLDALGQVQKKLVRWRIEGQTPPAGATLTAGSRTVGRLTSVAELDDGTIVALGFARRTHFEPGSTAQGDGFTGTVF